MKQIYLYFACLLFSVAVHGEKGPRAKTEKAVTKAGSVQFKFNNLAPAGAHKDSVLIIFDRCNRTGAGIVYNVFSADENRNIVIGSIPEGKYYVTIQGLGIHRHRMETVITVRSKKHRQMSIKMDDSEEFSKDKVIIPSFNANLASLSIVNMK